MVRGRRSAAVSSMYGISVAAEECLPYMCSYNQPYNQPEVSRRDYNRAITYNRNTLSFEKKYDRILL